MIPLLFFALSQCAKLRANYKFYLRLISNDALPILKFQKIECILPPQLTMMHRIFKITIHCLLCHTLQTEMYCELHPLHKFCQIGAYWPICLLFSKFTMNSGEISHTTWITLQGMARVALVVTFDQLECILEAFYARQSPTHVNIWRHRPCPHKIYGLSQHFVIWVAYIALPQLD